MKKAVASSLKTNLPDFRIGDTVKISVRIVEGEKERTQAFTGVVIARRGSGISETIIVRRIVNNEGVERTFPIHSPKIVSIEVIRSGLIRRAKLYYLRDRVGKSTRLKEAKSAAEKALTEGEAVSAPSPEAQAAEQTKKA